MPIKSPYETLGVPPGATEAEIRAAYRRLVQLHHPDHNQGSPESARRFEEVQEAYAQVLRERKRGPQPPPDPHLDSRLEDLERQVSQAYAAREKARRAAREAAAATREAAAATQRERKRPTDEELGYYSTEDSFASIITDAREELSNQLRHAREHPVAKRVSDLIDGLEELASKLDRPERR